MSTTDNQNKLYIPIQINGGESTPTDLLDRELYLCTSDMKIYANDKNGKIAPLNANEADEAKKIIGDNFKLFSNSITQSIIGKFYIEESGLVGDNTKATYPIISHFNIDQLKSMKLDKNMYGSALPKDGTEGQLFFKI